MRNSYTFNNECNWQPYWMKYSAKKSPTTGHKEIISQQKRQEHKTYTFEERRCAETLLQQQHALPFKNLRETSSRKQFHPRPACGPLYSEAERSLNFATIPTQQTMLMFTFLRFCEICRQSSSALSRSQPCCW